MDIEHMIGQMVLGSLRGRRKRSRRATRFLTGGGGSFLNASTLLTLGGLAWGVFETMGRQTAAPAGSPASPQPSPGPTATPVVPPPLPGAPPSTVVCGAVDAAKATPGEPVPAVIPEGALRIVRLMIAAARADGSLTPEERESILTQARAAGLEALAAQEIERPTPLAAILAGIADAAQRNDLYMLAFSIVRADEQVTGAERVFLARLAALLGLDPATVARLEQEAALRIDAEEQATDS